MWKNQINFPMLKTWFVFGAELVRSLNLEMDP